MEPLPAHLFVFWYALLSTITPPVCGAVFIASGMIGENWLRVALTAMVLGVGLYLIPLGMVANPGVMQIATAPGLALLSGFKIAIGLGFVSFALVRKKNPALRASAFGAGLLLILWPF